jgi:5'-3' exonuclease
MASWRRWFFLTDHFATDRIAFCFDSNLRPREDIFPGYKASRKAVWDALPKEEKQAREAARDQIDLLYANILPTIGYRNIFKQVGYEADDVIANICYKNIAVSRNRKAVIISNDSDLYQLLGPRVRMYRPLLKEFITHKTFRKRYGIKPSEWWRVKAMTGCGTDDVPGIDGIGNKSAIAYLRGELEGRRLKLIEENEAIIKRNEGLVRLPLQGIDPLTFVKDDVTAAGWRKIAKKLGIRSLP